MTFTRKFFAYPLVEKSSDGSVILSYNYTVNAIGQREQVNRTGSAFGAPDPLNWRYDALGQVAKADYSDSTLDQTYTYDQIGNRVSKTQSAASTQYTSNALNQFTSKTTSGSTENYLYDKDGNLLSDGTVTYTWDGEQCEPTSILDRSVATCPQGQNAKDECFDQNRLLSSSNNQFTTKYIYDYLSRRITKETNGITSEYVYDGWSPISEKAPTLTKYYTWGTDLSGSLQGAGGVGGLLSVTENNQTHYPTYDGNGNVSEYIDATSTTVAHYQYDAFGNTIASKTTGTKANDFAHRFSTKALDSETGFYYYGYRYYNPVTGTWPSRDPIEENGGVNLYGVVSNDTINKWDLLGLSYGCCGGKKMKRRQRCCGEKIASSGPNAPCCQDERWISRIPRWKKEGYKSRQACIGDKTAPAEVGIAVGVGTAMLGGPGGWAGVGGAGADYWINGKGGCDAKVCPIVL